MKYTQPNDKHYKKKFRISGNRFYFLCLQTGVECNSKSVGHTEISNDFLMSFRVFFS